MTTEEFSKVKELLERLAPEEPIIGEDDFHEWCCHCGATLYQYGKDGFEAHNDDCPWVAARRLIEEFSPNGD